MWVQAQFCSVEKIFLSCAVLIYDNKMPNSQWRANLHLNKRHIPIHATSIYQPTNHHSYNLNDKHNFNLHNEIQNEQTPI